MLHELKRRGSSILDYLVLASKSVTQMKRHTLTLRENKTEIERIEIIVPGFFYIVPKLVLVIRCSL